MGYSVPEHFAALDRLGPTIHHRRSFSPVAVAFGLIEGMTKVLADEAAAAVLPL
jgi:ribonuclease HII